MTTDNNATARLISTDGVGYLSTCSFRDSNATIQARAEKFYGLPEGSLSVREVQAIDDRSVRT